MQKLVREMAIANIRSCEQRITALELLQAALRIDVAASVIRTQIPDARFLVRKPLDQDKVSNWISISAESGVQEPGRDTESGEDHAIVYARQST